jgi:hypothetical protein
MQYTRLFFILFIYNLFQELFFGVNNICYLQENRGGLTYCQNIYGFSLFTAVKACFMILVYLCGICVRRSESLNYDLLLKPFIRSILIINLPFIIWSFVIWSYNSEDCRL